MNCPVCARSLAPTLSICPKCGAMMNDTVREELQSKIMPSPAKMNQRPIHSDHSTSLRTVAAPVLTPSPPARTLPKVVTSELVSPKTSPTLVGFQNKSTPIPDWRLQVQNAVQQRLGSRSAVLSPAAENAGPSTVAALVKEFMPAMGAEVEITDPRIARALRRIEDSRRTFLSPTAKPEKHPVQPVQKARSFPFDVVETSNRSAATQALKNTETVERPRLVQQEAVHIPKRGTIERPPIDLFRSKAAIKPIEMPSNDPFPTTNEILSLDAEPQAKIKIRSDNITIESHEADEIEDLQSNDIDDLAPFSMRFGAGLFDMIIGVFASMLILSPIAFTNSNWFTPGGLFLFSATSAVVLFIYMTVCLGFFGKTMGMRLFSLELVDAVENEYPTLQQAAVNSSIFIISLVFAGAGFLTVLFNEENRALHDLLSGTILVREF